jgi:hypothetical protein
MHLGFLGWSKFQASSLAHQFYPQRLLRSIFNVEIAAQQKSCLWLEDLQVSRCLEYAIE